MRLDIRATFLAATLLFTLPPAAGAQSFAPGAIATASETWEEPAGGGGVAAVELARLAGTTNLFCVLGADDLGTRARAREQAT